MPSKPPERARRQRREADREARKGVQQKQKLAAALPGGAANHPIDVSSASVVEIQARAIACIQCGGYLELRGDRASSTPRGVLRELEMACRRCHAGRRLWFRIAPALVS